MTDANVRHQVENGGNGMPAFKNLLPAADLEDVLVYLKTI